ncbi:MAG: NUDIX hydrolase [Chloroflexota bacterium]
MTFELVNTEGIYQGRAFNVRRDQVRLPDGRLYRLDIIDHHPAVTIVPVDKQGDIWFIRQYRHAAGKVLLELPAGVMETEETPEYSALRETREEIGMSAGSMQKIGGFFLAPGYSTEYMHVFLASDLYANPLQQDEDEFLSVEKIPANQVMKLIETGEIQDAKSLAALFLARPYLHQFNLPQPNPQPE